MIIHYKVGLYNGATPIPVEVLEDDGGIIRIRELDTNAIYRVRRADQLFPTFDEAKSALIDFNLLNIEFAEQRLAEARKALRALVALREPKHDA